MSTHRWLDKHGSSTFRACVNSSTLAEVRRELNEIVLLAAKTYNSEIACVGVIRSDKLQCDTAIGIPEGTEFPIEETFGVEVISSGAALVVEDAAASERYAKNPRVVGEQKVRFYAGVPLIDRDNHVFGTLCIVDREPRYFSQDDLAGLSQLGRLASRLIQQAEEIRQISLLANHSELNRKRLLRFLETVEHVFAECDSHGKYTFLSASWKYQFQFGIVESISKFVWDFVEDGERSYLQSLVQRLLSGELQQVRHRFRHLVADADPVWVEFRLLPRRELDGTISGMVCTITNVNEQVGIEALVQKQRLDIEATAKLSLLGEMAAGIAHEINNPLAILSGQVQMLSDRAHEGMVTQEVVLKACARLERMVERMSKTINGLKSFTRNDSSDPMEMTAVSKIVFDCLELVSDKFRMAGIPVTVSDVPSNIEIWCRGSQISQVLLNLLSNAFDAISNSENPWVKITFTREQNFLCFNVEDSGPGIPSHIRSKVLDPFFTTKEAGKGTGLGLSISKKIVEAHGGVLKIDADWPNTKFVVALPLCKD